MFNQTGSYFKIFTAVLGYFFEFHTSNKDEARIGAVLESSSGVIIEEAFHLEKPIINNEVEYKALIYGLELALKKGVQNLKVISNSELVYGHVNGFFEVKDKRMKTYCDMVAGLTKRF